MVCLKARRRAAEAQSVFRIFARIHLHSLGVQLLKLRILFFALVCFSSLVLAQQDPVAFISAGRGLTINQLRNDPNVLWKPEPNTNIAVGYGLWPGLFLVGYFDHNSFSFQGYYRNAHSAGSYSLSSLLLGGKASTTISGKILSPYFLGLVGLSWATSAQDTVFGSSNLGDLAVYHTIRGKTFTILGAVGSDIAIYKGLFAFGEVRASTGLDSSVYDLLIMWRAGIGFNLF